MSTVILCWAAFLLASVTETKMCLCEEIILPKQYTALEGDLQVDVLGVTSPARIQLLEYEPIHVSGVTQYKIMGSATVLGSNNDNVSNSILKSIFPCGVIARGGKFGFRIISEITNNLSTYDEDIVTQETTTTEVQEEPEKEKDDIVTLDVRWPEASISVEPKLIQTYPETPVTAKVSFHATHCQPAIHSLVPETWFDVVYCGHSPVNCTNSTHKQVVYSEQIRGYPTLREIVLKCDSFGLAGHYLLVLRSTMHSAGTAIATTPPEETIKAIWSDKFVFNVHARSIFPCDGHGGVNVLFQYPGCILENGDRVRVFGRLRADVAALIPPSTLHYVSEQRVSRGHHALNFDCELFTEKYIEYCFVYVSQAITGAVSDVRMDCVPTLPVHESDSGGWGPWTPWTKCTTTCSGGTRNRYRLCDSPPPRYGAKFCEGQTLETERCGVAVSFDCPFYQDSGGSEVPAERPEIKAEVGPGCRCGCVVHLGYTKPRRLVASSTQSCPGRSFWLIQSDEEHTIHMSLEQFKLPCSSQWLKIRDGDSLSSALLAQLTGAPLNLASITSTGPHLLLEFFSDGNVASGQECWGGFLAHAQQLGTRLANTSAHSIASLDEGPSPLARLALVHIAVLLFILFLLLASTCLGAQYVHKYRKYQLAAAAEEMDSITEYSITGSNGSLLPVKSRAGSSSTLISEVISLKKFRSHKHTRLPENDNEDDSEEYEDSMESLRKGDSVVNEIGAQKEDAQSKLIDNDRNMEPDLRPRSLEVGAQRFYKPPSDTPKIHLNLKQRKYKSPVSPVAEGPEATEAEERKPLKSENNAPVQPSQRHSNRGAHPSVSSSISSSLTTAASSPASSIRGINPKESKEKRNRERLLAGSEYSLTGNDTDLEMDYYDYNVSNNTAVPGSFLGMDPAFCVWIPPFAPGRWDDDDEDDQLIGFSDAEETELKEFAVIDNKTKLVFNDDMKSLEVTTEFSVATTETDSGSRTPVNSKSEYDVISEIHSCENNRQRTKTPNRNLRKTEKGNFTEDNNLKMVEKLKPDSPVKVHQAYRIKEKETKVEKSPSGDSEYYDLLDDEDGSEIKFADEDEDDVSDKPVEIEVDNKSETNKRTYNNQVRS